MPVAEQASNIDVDFLPAKFREKSAQRANNGWRIAVVGAFVAVVVLAALLQFGQLRQIRNEIAALEPQRVEAQARSERLGQVRQQLDQVEARARVATYLQHPWPRAQILHAVFEPLPATVTLRQVNLRPEARSPARVEKPKQPRGDDNAKQVKQSLPELTDLRVLREEYDARQTVVTLAGTTAEISDVHAYLGQVTEHPLVANAELVSAERDAADTLRLDISFEVRVLIRPGYGQPGGPIELPGKTVAGANSTPPGANSTPAPGA